MIREQTAALAAKRKSRGAAKRAAMLARMPAEFTTAELAEVIGIDKMSAAAYVQKMQKWGEVAPTSAYKSPRTWRKQ